MAIVVSTCLGGVFGMDLFLVPVGCTCDSLLISIFLLCMLLSLFLVLLMVGVVWFACVCGMLVVLCIVGCLHIMSTEGWWLPTRSLFSVVVPALLMQLIVPCAKWLANLWLHPKCRAIVNTCFHKIQLCVVGLLVLGHSICDSSGW